MFRKQKLIANNGRKNGEYGPKDWKDGAKD